MVRNSFSRYSVTYFSKIYFSVIIILILACHRTQILSEVAAKATRKLPQNKRVLILGEHNFSTVSRIFLLEAFFLGNVGD